MPNYPPALYGSNSETTSSATELSNLDKLESPKLMVTDLEENEALLNDDEREVIGLNSVDERTDVTVPKCDDHSCSSGGCGPKHSGGEASCAADDPAGCEVGCSVGASSNCGREVCVDDPSLPSVCTEVSTDDKIDGVEGEKWEELLPCSSKRDLCRQEIEGKSSSSPEITPPSMGEQSSTPSNDIRLRSSSAGAAVRRISVESAMHPRLREITLSDGKKRRWSMDNKVPNQNFPQVITYIWLVCGCCITVVLMLC